MGRGVAAGGGGFGVVSWFPAGLGGGGGGHDEVKTARQLRKPPSCSALGSAPSPDVSPSPGLHGAHSRLATPTAGGRIWGGDGQKTTGVFAAVLSHVLRFSLTAEYE